MHGSFLTGIKNDEFLLTILVLIMRPPPRTMVYQLTKFQW